jgi:hypothetical protein
MEMALVLCYSLCCILFVFSLTGGKLNMSAKERKRLAELKEAKDEE